MFSLNFNNNHLHQPWDLLYTAIMCSICKLPKRCQTTSFESIKNDATNFEQLKYWLIAFQRPVNPLYQDKTLHRHRWTHSDQMLPTDMTAWKVIYLFITTKTLKLSVVMMAHGHSTHHQHVQVCNLAVLLCFFFSLHNKLTNYSPNNRLSRQIISIHQS